MHALTIPYDMIHNYMYAHAQEPVRAKGLKERQTLAIIFFNNNYYSHTDWYIITIVQTSKLATWQKRLIYSPAGLLVRHIMK